MTEVPTAFLLVTRAGFDGCILRNDLGEQFTIPATDAPHIAIMLADVATDADDAEYAGEQWSGRAEEIREYGPDDDESTELLDQPREPLDEVDDNPYARPADRSYDP